MATSRPSKTPSKTIRRNRVTVTLNDNELKVLTRYCKRYNCKNRSATIRKILISHILKQFDQDAPTLFD